MKFAIRSAIRPAFRDLIRNAVPVSAVVDNIVRLVNNGVLSPLVTFTRSSAALYLDADGVYQEAAVDEPRVDYSSGQAGYLAEPARTNEALHSRDLTDAVWTASNMTVTLDQAGADGTSNTGNRLTADADNATLKQSLTDASSQQRTFSAVIKRLTGTGTVEITQDGTTWSDITSGIDSDYAQYSVTQTSTDPDFGFRLGTSGDEIVVDLTQLEDGSSPTSPIITAGTAVPRAADSAVSTIGDEFNQGSFSVVVDCNVVDDASNRYLYTLREVGGAGSHLQIRVNPDNTLALFVNTNGSIQVNAGVGGAGGITPGQRFKAAFRLENNNFAFCLNGGSVGTDISGVMELDGYQERAIGRLHTAATGQPGHINSIREYPYALTDAELVTLST